MSQADPSEGAQTGGSDGGALARLEFNVCKLELAFHELARLLEEEEIPPAAQPLGWSRRRHRQLVKFSVIAGGLSALLASSYALPPQNPVHQVVRYTVNALVEQLPDFQPAVSLLSPLSSHPAADVNQPSASPLVLSHADPDPDPSPQPAAQPVTDSPVSPQSSIPVSPATGLVLLPSATAIPAPSPTPTAIPSPSPTSRPSGPAPSPTGGAGPSSSDQQQQQGKAKKPKPSPSP